jgi:hypothetical protein
MAMKLDKSPTYYKSLELYAEAVSKGGMRSLTLEQVNLTGFDKVASGQDTFQIQEELTIVERGVLRQLSIKGARLMHIIMDELCWDNALWYFKSTGSNHRTALKELRDKNILLRTEDPNIHYVNPALVRRGSRASVLAKTTHLLSTVVRVDRSLIKDLRKTKRITLSGFDHMLGDK